LASWLDAHANAGHWLVRIEDVDSPRCVHGASEHILKQLAACQLLPDALVVYQSQRSSAYQAALQQLVSKRWAYPCGCSRKEIEDAQGERPRHSSAVYPGTCRQGLQGKPARAWRLNVQQVIDDLKLPQPWAWHDRWLGNQRQDVPQEVGDFVLLRADGLWAYQLAVVVDDAFQGINHVVRGADLADNTPRQMLLQQALGLPSPAYKHAPLVMGADGEKLSKQNGAQPLELTHPLAALNAAAQVLGLPTQAGTCEQALRQWTSQWLGGR
jgi:glutamyl-Q tRNA(Asp) synthetase